MYSTFERKGKFINVGGNVCGYGQGVSIRIDSIESVFAEEDDHDKVNIVIRTLSGKEWKMETNENGYTSLCRVMAEIAYV